MGDLLTNVTIRHGGHSAVFGPLGVADPYRYRLTRRLRREGPPRTGCVAFILLNPSTATAEQDDPTIRKCCAYAVRWGFGELIVGNVFALRSTDPTKLRSHPAPIGSGSNTELLAIAMRAAFIVCGWGRYGEGRGRSVARLLLDAGADLRFLKLNNDGSPAHPLYLSGKLTPQKWGGPDAP